MRALAARDAAAPTRCCISPPTAIRRRRPSARGGISSRTPSRSSRFSSTVRSITSSISRRARSTTACVGAVSPATPVSPRLPYAISKLASEHYVRFFAERRARARAATSTSASSAPTARTSRRARSRRAGCWRWPRGQREFTLRGDGENLIDFMYVDDAVDGMLRAGAGGAAPARRSTSRRARRSASTTSSQAMARTLGVDVTVRHEGETEEYIQFRSVDRDDARSLRLRAGDSVRRRPAAAGGVLRTGEACGRPPGIGSRERELHEYVAEVEGHDSQVTGVVGYFYAMYRAEVLARVAGAARARHPRGRLRRRA